MAATGKYSLQDISDMGFAPFIGSFKIYILHNSSTPDFRSASCTLRYGYTVAGSSTFTELGSSTAAFTYTDESSETGDVYLAVDFDFPRIDMSVSTRFPAIIATVTGTKRNGESFSCTSNVTRVVNMITSTSYWTGGYACYNILEETHPETRTLTVTVNNSSSARLANAIVTFRATDEVQVTGRTNASGIVSMQIGTNAGTVTVSHSNWVFNNPASVTAGSAAVSVTVNATGQRLYNRDIVINANLRLHEDEFTFSGLTEYFPGTNDIAPYMANVNIEECLIRKHSSTAAVNPWHVVNSNKFSPTLGYGGAWAADGQSPYINTGLKDFELEITALAEPIDILFTVKRPGFLRKSILYDNVSVTLIESDDILYILPVNNHWSSRAEYEKSMLRRIPNKTMTAEEFGYIWQDAIRRLNDVGYVIPDFEPLGYDELIEAWQTTIYLINGGHSEGDEFNHVINYYHRGANPSYPVLPKDTNIYTSDDDIYFLYTFTETLDHDGGNTVLPARIFTSDLYRAYSMPEAQRNALGTGVNNRSLRLDQTLLPIYEVIPECNVNISNGQWVASGSTAGAPTYMSKTSYHVNNGSACTYIDMYMVSSVTLMVYTNGESNYDYLTVSEVDKTPTRSNITGGTSGNFWSGYGKASNSFYRITIPVPRDTINTHRITLMYAKDGSAHTEPDCAKFYIERWTYYPTK